MSAFVISPSITEWPRFLL